MGFLAESKRLVEKQLGTFQIRMNLDRTIGKFESATLKIQPGVDGTV